MKLIIDAEEAVVTVDAVLVVDPPCQLIKTGQETTYRPVALDDDGALELGIAPSFTVLTTGRYFGAVNLIINGKTHATSNACVLNKNTGDMFLREVIQSDIGPAADGKLFWDQWTLGPKTDISFDAATKKINSVAGDFDIGACCIGRKITVSGAAQGGNNQVVTVAGITANDITTDEVLVNEAAGASVSFATVDDTIFDLKDQANAAALAGYTDWRIPNLKELNSIVDLGQYNPVINTTAFPSTPTIQHWTSSTHGSLASRAWTVHFANSEVRYYTKSTFKYCVRLVR